MSLKSALMKKYVLLAVLSFFTTAPAYAGIVIGAYDSNRVDGWSVFNLGIADFIPRVIPGSSFVGTPTLTPEFLSGIDVLVLTSNDSFSTSTYPLAASERAALLDFIKSGHGVVAVTSDEPSFTEPFGMAIGRDQRTAARISTVPDPSISPVTSGPYGTITSFTMDLFGGYNNIFTSLGPYSQAIAFNGYGLPTLAVIQENVVAPGSGRVVLFADPESVLDSFNKADGLILNSIVYAAGVPEASSVVMLCTTMIVALPIYLAICAKRKRSSRGDSCSASPSSFVR